VMTGNAVQLAACELREQLLGVAAVVLEVERSELTWAGGRAVASDGTAPLRELAGTVHWDGGSSEEPLPQLIATATFSGQGAGAPDPDDRVNAALAYGFMADVAVVEIDKDTLIPRVVSYAAVHDVGNTLEPGLVAGQAHGGIANGIGGALLEHLSYNDDGQLLAPSLVDYHCVTAADAPDVVVEHVNAPSPFNPLGVKGSGESSAMTAPAAIAAAIDDALRHAGVSVNALPVDPVELWRSVSS